MGAFRPVSVRFGGPVQGDGNGQAQNSLPGGFERFAFGGKLYEIPEGFGEPVVFLFTFPCFFNSEYKLFVIAQKIGFWWLQKCLF